MNFNIDYSDIESSLSELKEYFAPEINSKRKLEQISTVDELFEVLSDRDVLTEKKVSDLGLDFQNFINLQIKKSNQYTKPFPNNVVKLLKENFQEDWNELGLSMNLSENDLEKCCNVVHVLKCYQDSSKGKSQQEIMFGLMQALENCGREDLKIKILNSTK